MNAKEALEVIVTRALLSGTNKETGEAIEMLRATIEPNGEARNALSPARKYRAAAATLLERSFVALAFWIDGDKQTRRDEHGCWTYFGDPIGGDIRAHLESVYQLAAWLEGSSVMVRELVLQGLK